MSKRVFPLVAIVLLIFIQACDRTVTYVQEPPTQTAQNCFSCHDDQNTFLVAAEQQWSNSFHASGLNIDRGSSAGCAGCHTGDGFVQRANGETVTGHDNPTTIHCFTCHAPHTNGNFGLRWTANATLENGASFNLGAGNLCAACHVARRNVDTYVGTSGSSSVNINSTHWGPHHGVQGDMIVGSNGYEYAGYSYEITSHRSNPNACIACHKAATSNNVVGGHAFNMRGSARDEGGEFSDVLNVAACTPCHGSLSDFDYDIDGDGIGAQTELLGMAAILDSLLTDANLWTSGHPVQRVTTADSAGAVWNLLMFEEDRSWGVHNAKYLRGLLQSSINFLNGTLSAPKAPVATKEDDDKRVTQK
jgi:hypothetical protein